MRKARARVLAAAFFCAMFSRFAAADESAEKGVALCRSVERILSGRKIEWRRVSLAPGGRANDFPYNILATVRAAKNPESHDDSERGSILLALRMEDALARREMTNELLSRSAAAKIDCDLLLLFSYGDDQPPALASPVSGTPAFISRMDATDECAALCVSFGGADEAVIFPGGGGEFSPRFLVERIFDACAAESLPRKIKGSALSALYRLGAIQSDARTAAFLSAGVAAAGVSFPKNADDNRAADVLARFVGSYSREGTGEWDRHFIAFRAGNRLRFVGERAIVLCFMVTAFLGIFLQCIPMQRRGEKLRRDILRLWHIFPVTAFLTIAAFTLSQSAARLAHAVFGAGLFNLFCVKIIAAFFLATVVHFLSVHFLARRDDRAYGYALSLVSLADILVFSAIDISLVFLFALEHVVVMATRRARTTGALAASLALMTVPFFPYMAVLYNSADARIFVSFVYSDFAGNLIFALVIMPFLIQWIRIIARLDFVFKKRWKARGKKFALAASVSTAAAVVSAALFMNVARALAKKFAGREKTAETSAIKFIEIGDGALVCSVKDSDFFGETLREVKIDTGKQCVLCKVEIRSEEGESVVYSDSVTDGASGAKSFLVPSWPPSKMRFSFTADASIPSALEVSAVYESEAGNVYELRKAREEIPARGGSAK